MVNQIRCLACGDIITSLSQHDFKWCDCHSVFVDGGTEYQRIGGEYKLIEVWVDDRFIPLDILVNKPFKKFNDQGNGI